MIIFDYLMFVDEFQASFIKRKISITNTKNKVNKSRSKE